MCRIMQLNAVATIVLNKRQPPGARLIIIIEMIVTIIVIIFQQEMAVLFAADQYFLLRMIKFLSSRQKRKSYQQAISHHQGKTIFLLPFPDPTIVAKMNAMPQRSFYGRITIPASHKFKRNGARQFNIGISIVYPAGDEVNRVETHFTQLFA